jgi:hypothetical protein
MALNKIAGETLESNLIRSTDLSFNDTLLHLDVSNGRIGIGTASPGNFKLDVNGNTRITGDLTVQGTTTTVDSQNLAVEDNLIVINSSGSVGHNSGMMINRGAEGNNAVMIWDESTDKFLIWYHSIRWFHHGGLRGHAVKSTGGDTHGGRRRGHQGLR